MVGSYKKKILLMFCLLHVSYSQTFSFLSQNFCLNLAGEEDNLSCPNATVQEGVCFDSDRLCDGVSDCFDGIDEGEGVANLRCEWEWVWREGGREG